MVNLPLKKCYHVSKLCALVILVVTVLSLLERYRGGKKSVSSATEVEVELERQIVEDEARIIPNLGQGGIPATLQGEEKRLGEESEKQYAINVYLSDRIPYNRTLKDFRNPSCKRVVYDAELPSASVIIIFHNEPYSVVIRTLWSVINSARRENPWFRNANYINKKTGKGMNLGYKGQDTDSPFVYLKEIILVDDNSTLPELKDKLSHYVRTRLPPDLIRILRLPDRVGLTRARLAGARYASGDVLVFLDAHCESQPDWMRPLLQRIKDSPHAVVVPVIDVIEASDFYYSVMDPVVFQIGGFTFSGHFIWIDVPEREKKRRGSDISPTWSPTMAGGLFAIKRSYYWELGAYDEQMAGWGGENLEMSFRIWQCGGTLETIPCSRVGHVFRSFHPYGLPAQSDTHGINTARMAEVWMDDFAELFYLHRPDLRKSEKIGDVTHRRVLREKLKCKSFQWYLDNIYKEKFVPVRDVDAFGRFMNPVSGLCLDTLQREQEPAPLGVYPCHATLQPTQYLALSRAAQLRDEERCAHVRAHARRDGVDGEDDSRAVMMMSCRPHQRGQKWRLIPSTHQIQNVESRLCLESPLEAGADVVARRCDERKKEQRWHIDYTENSFDNNNIDPGATSQEIKLQKLRGQHRISRSLFSRSDDNAATRRRKSKKNRFVLKLLRNVNGTEQHLEADIHCKHRVLYPNDTFVRDIVTILNEKDIRVINNGRVFEKNRVYEVARKKKKSTHSRNKFNEVIVPGKSCSLCPNGIKYLCCKSRDKTRSDLLIVNVENDEVRVNENGLRVMWKSDDEGDDYETEYEDEYEDDTGPWLAIAVDAAPDTVTHNPIDIYPGLPKYTNIEPSRQRQTNVKDNSIVHQIFNPNTDYYAPKPAQNIIPYIEDVTPLTIKPFDDYNHVDVNAKNIQKKARIDAEVKENYSENSKIYNRYLLANNTFSEIKSALSTSGVQTPEERWLSHNINAVAGDSKQTKTVIDTNEWNPHNIMPTDRDYSIIQQNYQHETNQEVNNNNHNYVNLEERWILNNIKPVGGDLRHLKPDLSPSEAPWTSRNIAPAGRDLNILISKLRDVLSQYTTESNKQGIQENVQEQMHPSKNDHIQNNYSLPLLLENKLFKTPDLKPVGALMSSQPLYEDTLQKMLPMLSGRDKRPNSNHILISKLRDVVTQNNKKKDKERIQTDVHNQIKPIKNNTRHPHSLNELLKSHDLNPIFHLLSSHPLLETTLQKIMQNATSRPNKRPDVKVVNEQDNASSPPLSNNTMDDLQKWILKNIDIVQEDLNTKKPTAYPEKNNGENHVRIDDTSNNIEVTSSIQTKRSKNKSVPAEIGTHNEFQDKINQEVVNNLEERWISHDIKPVGGDLRYLKPDLSPSDAPWMSRNIFPAGGNLNKLLSKLHDVATQNTIKSNKAVILEDLFSNKNVFIENSTTHRSLPKEKKIKLKIKDLNTVGSLLALQQMLEATLQKMLKNSLSHRNKQPDIEIVSANEKERIPHSGNFTTNELKKWITKYIDAFEKDIKPTKPTTSLVINNDEQDAIDSTVSIVESTSSVPTKRLRLISKKKSSTAKNRPKNNIISNITLAGRDYFTTHENSQENNYQKVANNLEERWISNNIKPAGGDLRYLKPDISPSDAPWMSRNIAPAGRDLSILISKLRDVATQHNSKKYENVLSQKEIRPHFRDARKHDNTIILHLIDNTNSDDSSDNNASNGKQNTDEKIVDVKTTKTSLDINNDENHDEIDDSSNIVEMTSSIPTRKSHLKSKNNYPVKKRRRSNINSHKNPLLGSSFSTTTNNDSYVRIRSSKHSALNSNNIEDHKQNISLSAEMIMPRELTPRKRAVNLKDFSYNEGQENLRDKEEIEKSKDVPSESFRYRSAKVKRDKNTHFSTHSGLLQFLRYRKINSQEDSDIKFKLNALKRFWEKSMISDQNRVFEDQDITTLRNPSMNNLYRQDGHKLSDHDKFREIMSRNNQVEESYRTTFDNRKDNRQKAYNGPRKYVSLQLRKMAPQTRTENSAEISRKYQVVDVQDIEHKTKPVKPNENNYMNHAENARERPYKHRAIMQKYNKKIPGTKQKYEERRKSFPLMRPQHNEKSHHSVSRHRHRQSSPARHFILRKRHKYSDSSRIRAKKNPKTKIKMTKSQIVEVLRRFRKIKPQDREKLKALKIDWQDLLRPSDILSSAVDTEAGEDVEILHRNSPSKQLKQEDDDHDYIFMGGDSWNLKVEASPEKTVEEIHSQKEILQMSTRSPLRINKLLGSWENTPQNLQDMEEEVVKHVDHGTKKQDVNDETDNLELYMAQKPSHEKQHIPLVSKENKQTYRQQNNDHLKSKESSQDQFNRDIMLEQLELSHLAGLENLQLEQENFHHTMKPDVIPQAIFSQSVEVPLSKPESHFTMVHDSKSANPNSDKHNSKLLYFDSHEGLIKQIDSREFANNLPAEALKKPVKEADMPKHSFIGSTNNNLYDSLERHILEPGKYRESSNTKHDAYTIIDNKPYNSPEVTSKPMHLPEVEEKRTVENNYYQKSSNKIHTNNKPSNLQEIIYDTNYFDVSEKPVEDTFKIVDSREIIADRKLVNTEDVTYKFNIQDTTIAVTKLDSFEIPQHSHELITNKMPSRNYQTLDSLEIKPVNKPFHSSENFYSQQQKVPNSNRLTGSREIAHGNYRPNSDTQTDRLLMTVPYEPIETLNQPLNSAELSRNIVNSFEITTIVPLDSLQLHENDNLASRIRTMKPQQKEHKFISIDLEKISSKMKNSQEVQHKYKIVKLRDKPTSQELNAMEQRETLTHTARDSREITTKKSDPKFYSYIDFL